MTPASQLGGLAGRLFWSRCAGDHRRADQAGTSDDKFGKAACGAQLRVDPQRSRRPISAHIGFGSSTTSRWPHFGENWWSHFREK